MNRIALSPNSMIGVPALEYIDALAKAGYDGIGLRTYASPGVNYESVTQPITGNPGLMRDIKHALNGSGLEPVDALSYYIRPNFDLDHMMPSLEFVAELGFPYALAICDDPEWNRQVDNFAKLCDACRDLRVMVSMEAPVTQNQVNTLPKALDVIKQSGKDNAVICLDPMHFWRVGHQPSMLREEDPKLFPYTQFRDGSPTSGPGARPEAGALTEQPGMGQGHVPLGDILDNLPRGLLLSIEWGRPRGSDYTPHQWAQRALDGTKRVVERYYADKDAAAGR